MHTTSAVTSGLRSSATDPFFDFSDLDGDAGVFQDPLPPIFFEEDKSLGVEEITLVATSILQASDSSYEPSDQVQSDESSRVSSSLPVPAKDEDTSSDKGRIITPLTAEQKLAIRKEKNRLCAQAFRQRKKGQIDRSVAFQQAFVALGLQIGPQLQQFQQYFPGCFLDPLPNLEELEECSPEEQLETFKELQTIFADVITTAIEYKAAQDAESAKLRRRIQALEAENAQLKKP